MALVLGMCSVTSLAAQNAQPAPSSPPSSSYGDQWEVRGEENWYLMKKRGIRLNGEWMYVNRSPVEYTAYPYPVGAKGTIFHINLEMNF